LANIAARIARSVAGFPRRLRNRLEVALPERERALDRAPAVVVVRERVEGVRQSGRHLERPRSAAREHAPAQRGDALAHADEIALRRHDEHRQVAPQLGSSGRP
jgi:hypothetical protein